MADLISQQLTKASEDLRKAIAAHAKINVELQKMKSKFIAQTNPVTQEKMKAGLMILTKQERLAKAALDKAESVFHDILKTEPEDVIDLLDHRIKEQYLRMLIRKKLHERLSKKVRKVKKSMK